MAFGAEGVDDADEFSGDTADGDAVAFLQFFFVTFVDLSQGRFVEASQDKPAATTEASTGRRHYRTGLPTSGSCSLYKLGSLWFECDACDSRQLH